MISACSTSTVEYITYHILREGAADSRPRGHVSMHYLAWNSSVIVKLSEAMETGRRPGLAISVGPIDYLAGRSKGITCITRPAPRVSIRGSGASARQIARPSGPQAL